MLQLDPIMMHFAYSHLPENLQKVSKPFGDLAEVMATSLPDCEEAHVGLRKLLEAKDCAVRAARMTNPMIRPQGTGT